MTQKVWCVPPIVSAITDDPDRALLIGPDNQRTGWTSVTAAVRTDQPYAVPLARRLLVVDLDVDQRNDRDQHEPFVTMLLDAAAGADVPAVTVDSGRGWHVYLNIGSVAHGPLTAAIKLHRPHIGTVDVRPPGALIRPPGAKHRQARCPITRQPLHARLLDPPDVAVAALTRPVDRQAVVTLVDTVRRELADSTDDRPSRTTVPQRRNGQLDVRTIQALTCPPPVGSRSEVAFGITVDAVIAGYDQAGWQTLIAGTWVEARHRTKGGRLARRYDLEWANAHKVLTARTRRPAGDSWADQARLQAATMAGPPGRWWAAGGAAIYDVALRLVAATGQPTVHLAVRTAAELAGMSRSAAARHLTHLERTGLIVRQSAGDVRQGWMVTVDRDAHTRRYGPPGGPQGRARECPTSDSLALTAATQVAADVFVTAAAGKPAWRIWVAATAGTTPTCTQAGVGPRRLRRALRDLHLAGLLDPSGRPQPADKQLLASAAERFDTAGTGLLRAQQHQDERERFAPVGARWQARRDPQLHPTLPLAA